MPQLQDIMNPEMFKKAIHEGFISERFHPENTNIRVYSYTSKTQYAGMWTPETLNSRGLILEIDSNYTQANILGRGLQKFFTIEQTETEWGKAKIYDDDENVIIEENAAIPWNSPALVSEKLNGALILAYQHHDTVEVSTKGSFESREANIARHILKNYDTTSMYSFMHNITMLFEIITPQRPHPVDYGDTEDLFYLGYIENDSGKWVPATHEHAMVSLGFPYAKVMEYSTLQEAMEAPYKDNTEGMVVTINTTDHEQAMYKIKPEEYAKLRKLFYLTQKKDLMKYVDSFDSKTFMDLTIHDIDVLNLLEMPHKSYLESMAEERNTMMYNDCIVPIQDHVQTVSSITQKIIASMDNPSNRAEFAKIISQKTNKAELFAAYDDLCNNKIEKTVRTVRKRIMKEMMQS